MPGYLKTAILTPCLLLLMIGIAHANMGPMHSGFYRSVQLGILLFFTLILAITWNPTKDRTQILIVVVLLLASWTVYIHRRPPVHYNDMIFWNQSKRLLESIQNALTEYRSEHPENKFPVGSLDFRQLKDEIGEIWSSHNIPPQEDMFPRWSKLHYISPDGISYIFSARVEPWRTTGTIIATPEEILPKDYYDHLYLFKGNNKLYWEYLIFDRSRIEQIRQKFIEAGHGELLKY